MKELQAICPFRMGGGGGVFIFGDSSFTFQEISPKGKKFSFYKYVLVFFNLNKISAPRVI